MNKLSRTLIRSFKHFCENKCVKIFAFNNSSKISYKYQMRFLNHAVEISQNKKKIIYNKRDITCGVNMKFC